jgi:hypothetical protein
MKRSHSAVSTTAIVFGLLAMAGLSASAQITVFNDNLATDASDPSASYLSANTVSGTSDSWTWAGGTGITLNTAASGKLVDLVGAFTPVSLANTGDYVSFVVNFNSPNIAQGGASLAGNLLFALDNSGGTSLFNGLTGPPWVESNSSGATGGPTAGSIGYLGDIAFNNSPKTGTKFFAKTGAGNNNLSYNSNVSPKTQLSTSVGNASNANLANNDSYTLTYTVTALNAGASQMQITASIYDNTLGAMEDNFTIGATNGAVYVTPTTTFDTFDVGLYTGGETAGYNINLGDISVLTNVPEPTIFALVGLGVLGWVTRLRRR